MATRTSFGFDYQRRQRSSHSISSLLKYCKRRLIMVREEQARTFIPKDLSLTTNVLTPGVELVPESFPWNNPFPGKGWLIIRLFSFLFTFVRAKNGSLPTSRASDAMNEYDVHLASTLSCERNVTYQGRCRLRKSAN